MQAKQRALQKTLVFMHPDGRNAFDFGTFEINNNQISNGGFAGITLDAGNDGVDGNQLDQFSPNLAPGGRETATTTPTQVRGSISNNTIEANGFGVALANIDGGQPASGVDPSALNVNGNDINIGGDRSFGGGIHIEHSSQNINFEQNNITATGSNIKNGIGAGTFTDFGNTASFSNGTDNLRFAGNTANVFGKRGEGFVAAGASNLRFEPSGGQPNSFQRGFSDGSFATSTASRLVDGQLPTVASNDGSFTAAFRNSESAPAPSDASTCRVWACTCRTSICLCRASI